MLGMLLVTLEDLEPRRQEILELRIARVRNERGFERSVHRFVVGNFVVRIGFVEFGDNIRIVKVFARTASIRGI